MLSVDEKKVIIEENSVTKGDTGSPEVQISLLTANINKLQNHFGFMITFRMISRLYLVPSLFP